MWKIVNLFSILFIVLIILTAYSFTILVSGKATPRTGNYTVNEREAIEKLRSLLGKKLYKDYMRRDEYLIRWILDQNFNVENARDKLSVSLKWRKDNNVDSVLEEDFSDLEKLCHFDITGRDKSGRPLLQGSIGSCPVRKIVISGNTERLRRLFNSVYERCVKIVSDLQAQGKPINDGAVIGNLNSFNWREHACLRCIPLIVEFLTLYDNHYPRYLHAVYAINVPRVFEGISSIVLPLLSEHSRSIFHVYGFNNDEWRAVLLKNISPDQLETQFGGTKTFIPFAPRPTSTS